MAPPSPRDPAILYQSRPRANGSTLRVRWCTHALGPYLRAEVSREDGATEGVNLSLAEVPGVARALALALERADALTEAAELRAAGKGDA